MIVFPSPYHPAWGWFAFVFIVSVCSAIALISGQLQADLFFV